MTDTAERIDPAREAHERIDPAEAAHLARLQARMQEARVALSSFGEFLAAKYGLGQADMVNPTTGAILRQAQDRAEREPAEAV